MIITIFISSISPTLAHPPPQPPSFAHYSNKHTAPSQQLARRQHLQQLHRIPRQRPLLPHAPTHLLHRVFPRGLRLTLPSIPHKRQLNQHIEVRNHLSHRRLAFHTAPQRFHHFPYSVTPLRRNSPRRSVACVSSSEFTAGKSLFSNTCGSFPARTNETVSSTKKKIASNSVTS